MASSIDSRWFTAQRLERLARSLVEIPSAAGAGPLGAAEVVRLLWRKCGGPIGEVPALLSALETVGLVVATPGSIARTRIGDRVARAVRAGNKAELGLALVRSGHFHDQARVLIASGRKSADGTFTCSSAVTRSGAAQLVGMLAWWDAVKAGPVIVIPGAVLAELDSVWALMPPPPEQPAWLAERKAVGDRAEMYSFQLERTNALEPSLIAWVSRDSDALGYDVEDRTITPPRCIEVKGRRDSDQVFFLSDNEWRKAQALGERYEVHFWGDIQLSRHPSVEYSHLRASGYPVVIKDLARHVAQGRLALEPVQWRVTLP